MKNLRLLFLFFTVVFASNLRNSESNFVRITESEEEIEEISAHGASNDDNIDPLTAVIDHITSRNVDLSQYDLYGNYLGPADCTLPVNHFFCKRQVNNSDYFRRFAGLLMSQERSEKLKDVGSFGSYAFFRLNELKNRYYKGKADAVAVDEASSTFSVEEADLDRLKSIESFNFWNSPRVMNKGPEIKYPDSYKQYCHKLKKMFPLLYENVATEEKMLLAELLIVDVMYLFFPNLRGCPIDYSADISGMMILLFLVQVDDLEGYANEFIDYYKLMQNFAGAFPFELPSMRGNSVSLNKLKLLEELFRLSVDLDMPYTLELFYSLELVDVESENLMKFILNESNCPLVINRFLDLVPWQKDFINPHQMSRVHFIYENYPGLLMMLYEYEPMRIDWTVGEFGSELGGRTILGRMLLAGKNSLFADDGKDSLPVYITDAKELLSEFLTSIGEDRTLLLTHRNPDRDLLDECLKSESENKLESFSFNSSIAMLSEYYECSKLSCEKISEFIGRIVDIWSSDPKSSDLHSTIFKFLLKKCECECSREVFPKLKEAFEYLSQQESSLMLQRNSSSSSLNSVESSSKSFKIGFRLPSFDFRRSSDSPSPITPESSPRNPNKNNNRTDLITALVSEANRIALKEPQPVRDQIENWKILMGLE